MNWQARAEISEEQHARMNRNYNAAVEELVRYRTALEEIARQDYRGNRPRSSTVAYYALHPEEKP